MLNFFKISRFFLYLIPLAAAIVSSSTLFPFIVGKYSYFRSGVDLALIFFCLGLLLNDGQNLMWRRLGKIWKSPLVIAITVFAFFFVLAGFLGVDPLFSFWSNFERGEGGFQIIHLWLFFLLLSLLMNEEGGWRKMFWISLAGASLMILYGVAGVLGWQGFISGGTMSDFIHGKARFMGSIGNPAYVATYLIFAMFYAAYLLLNKNIVIPVKNNIVIPAKAGIQNNFQRPLWQKILLIVFIIFFFVFFWLAATRGAFGGLALGLILAGLYFAFCQKKWRKWLMGAIIIFVAAISALIYFQDTNFVKSVPGSRIFTFSLSAETWKDRTYMWKIAWDGFKERPLLGWGPENYLHIFDQHFNVNYFKPAAGFGAWFDRAHSVFFDYLAETGILGLLSYLAIYVVFYWRIIKFQMSDVGKQTSGIAMALIFAMPVAYLVQGVVLFEVLPLYLNLFLFMAFANYVID